MMNNFPYIISEFPFRNVSVKGQCPVWKDRWFYRSFTFITIVLFPKLRFSCQKYRTGLVWVHLQTIVWFLLWGKSALNFVNQLNPGSLLCRFYLSISSRGRSFLRLYRSRPSLPAMRWKPGFLFSFSCPAGNRLATDSNPALPVISSLPVVN